MMQAEIIKAEPRSDRAPTAISGRTLTTSELVDLSRALHTLMNVAEGLTFLPGLLDGSSATAAGSRFDKIAQAICDEYLEVMTELRDSQPRTSREAADRGCDLLAHDLNCDQDTTDLALATVRRAFPGRY